MKEIPSFVNKHTFMQYSTRDQMRQKLAPSTNLSTNKNKALKFRTENL